MDALSMWLFVKHSAAVIVTNLGLFFIHRIVYFCRYFPFRFYFQLLSTIVNKKY